MTTRLERRVVPTEFEFRDEGASGFQFEGYALKWDRFSQNLGGFRERIRQGATDDTIREDDIRALFNHDRNLVLGRNVAGTLDLSTDDTGTYYRVKGGNQSYARDLRESMERGDVTQSSFGFRVPVDGDEWDEDEDGFLIRSVIRMSLLDVSPVTYPAYLDSTSGVSGAREALAEAEQRGFSVDPVTGKVVHGGRERSAPTGARVLPVDNDLLVRFYNLR